MTDNLEFITEKELSFYTSPHGLLMARKNGEDIGRVTVLRMFPLRFLEEYLCVKTENYSRSDKENEIGIIKSLASFPSDEKELVRKELEKRYFVPDITEVYEVKEEFGHTVWKTKTTAGDREFTVNDMGTNIRNLGNNRVMMTDVYGNRYYIPDITKADDKTLKIIEIWV